MEILVLGGQGFIGQNLCNRLVQEGHKVHVLDNYIDTNRIIEGVDYIKGDFLDVSTYKNVLSNVDVVYHMISTTNANNSNKEIERDIKENVLGTIQLLDACVESKVKKVIFPSSGGTIYGIPEEIPIKETHPNNPICSYGITKLTIEKYLSLYNYLYNLDYVSLRLSNPYGPLHQSMTQGLINVILNKTLNNEIVEIWGDGKVERDYIYIDDVIDALSMVKDITTEQKVFNIGSGQSTSICDIISDVESIVGHEINKVFKPGRNQDVPINVLDISLAKEVLNWEPKVGLTEGINNTYQYLLKGNEEVNHIEKVKK